MILPKPTLNAMKDKSGLLLDKATDYMILAKMISDHTRQSIGVTTLKRLTGYIDDPRHTNKGTLNIIAQYLGYNSWENYVTTLRIDSDWNIESDTIWISELSTGSLLEIAYLNRRITMEVINTIEGKAFKILAAQNSSLRTGDIAFIDKIKKGELLEARKVCRGEFIGSYRTNGEVKSIHLTHAK